MAIEIVSFPNKNGGSFHSYVSHYQRVIVLILIPSLGLRQATSILDLILYFAALMTTGWQKNGMKILCEEPKFVQILGFSPWT